MEESINDDETAVLRVRCVLCIIGDLRHLLGSCGFSLSVVSSSKEDKT